MSECQRLCRRKTIHGPVHDVPYENSLILPVYRHIWKVRRFVQGGLPFRFCDRLELTLVFEARDLSSVIQQTVRSGIWRNLRRRKLYLARTACDNQSSESPSLSFGRTGRNSHGIQRRSEYGVVLQRTISDTRRWIVFLFGVYNMLLWLWTTHLAQKSWLLKTLTTSR